MAIKAPKLWSEDELNFAIRKLKGGVRPQQFMAELNKKFGSGRTCDGLKRKLYTKSLNASAIIKSTAVPAEPISIEKQIEQDLHLHKEATRLAILSRKYKLALKEQDLSDTILTMIEGYIKALPEVKSPKPIKRKYDEHSEEDLVLLLSDLHAGETVRAEEMNNINEYNFDICAKRLKYLADSIRDIAHNKLKGYKFRKLVIFGLGDIISGQIHDELLEGQEGNIIEWTTNTAYVLAQMIRELLTDFEQIEFVGVVGNHGRFHKKPRFKSRYVNWDYVCYQMLSMFLANQKNIKFTIPKSFWTLYDVNGHNFLLLHGDNINSSLGIPWYGITRTVANLKELLESKNQKFEYVCLGHFHNRGLLDRVKGELMINGSLIGGNEYSIGKMFTSSEACQHFFGVHKKKGTTFSYKLKVQEIPEYKEKPYNYVEDKALGDLIKTI
jgi:hypothetical protein